MKVVLAVVASLLLCSAQALPTQSDSLSQNVNNLINSLTKFYSAFGKIKTCGYAPLNIPVLEPIRVSSYNFNVQDEDLSVVGDYSNLYLSGLTNFFAVETSFNASNNVSTIDIVYPEMQVFGDYKLDVDTNIGGYPFKYNGKGVLNTRITDYRFVGKFTLAQSPSNAQAIKIVDYNINMYIGDAAMNNWNKLWDISVNNFVNKWQREALLLWMQEMQPKFNSLFGPVYIPNINSIIENLPVVEIVNWLNEQTTALQQASCN